MFSKYSFYHFHFLPFFFHDHNITDSTKKNQPLFHNKATYKLCLTENIYFYYINCSVLQEFLPPRNVVSEHT